MRSVLAARTSPAFRTPATRMPTLSAAQKSSLSHHAPGTRIVTPLSSTRDGSRVAITATCAAHAADSLEPAGAGARESARAAFAALGEHLRRPAGDLANAVLDGAVDKIAHAAGEAAHAHDLPSGVPLVALGGAGAALAPAVAERLGRECVIAENAEVLSSIGAALSLVRAEVVRHGSGSSAAAEVGREAERACVANGAAPQTVRVETSFEPRAGILSSVATGAVALESGAAGRDPLDEPAQLRQAAAALGLAEHDLGVLLRSDFFRVFSENGSGRVAVVDGLGSIALAEDAKVVIADDCERLLDRLGGEVSRATVNLGVGELLPRVAVIRGPHLVDLSAAHRAEDLIAGAREVLAEDDRPVEPAVAVIW